MTGPAATPTFRVVRDHVFKLGTAFVERIATVPTEVEAKVIAARVGGGARVERIE